MLAVAVGGGVFGHPDEVVDAAVGAVGGELVGAAGLFGDWFPGGGAVAAPFFDFGVAVAKGVAAGAVVVAGGAIDDGAGGGGGDGFGCRAGHGHSAGGVVVAIGMFVDKDPGLGRLNDVGSFLVAAPGVTCANECSREPEAFVEDLAHGDAADAGDHGVGGIADAGDVGRALPKFGVFADEGEHRASVNVDGGIPVRAGVAVVEAACAPIFAALVDGAGFAAGEEEFVEVVGVKFPADHELAIVVHALDAFGFGFGFAKGGEKHAGQDGDDGDDDEEFDEGETVRARGSGDWKGPHNVWVV